MIPRCETTTADNGKSLRRRIRRKLDWTHPFTVAKNHTLGSHEVLRRAKMANDHNVALSSIAGKRQKTLTDAGLAIGWRTVTGQWRGELYQTLHPLARHLITTTPVLYRAGIDSWPKKTVPRSNTLPAANSRNNPKKCTGCDSAARGRAVLCNSIFCKNAEPIRSEPGGTDSRDTPLHHKARHVVDTLERSGAWA